VQAENERKAAVARQERISLFMIESLFALLRGCGSVFFGAPIGPAIVVLVIIGFRGRF